MRHMSLFAGIGGFDLGFERVGMESVGQVEIDSHCREVLSQRFPGVPRWEDVKDVTGAELPDCDVLTGGFPCQDISVAGRRAGLAGDRSGLWFEFARIIAETSPRWVVIENVPGLLSSNGGRDMGTILGFLGEHGYGWAYRVLDAQWFGVPQRRRRVFIVGHLGGDGASEVLALGQGSRRDSPPSRDTGSFATQAFTGSTFGGGGADDNRAQGGFVVAFQSNAGNRLVAELHEDQSPPLKVPPNGPPAIVGQQVRRLTPTECARLQGFPDDWNDWLSDTQRYRQFGNAVAVPVAEWLGRQLMELGRGEETHGDDPQ